MLDVCSATRCSAFVSSPRRGITLAVTFA